MTVPHDCPSCGASVPADAAWCSLCFARFDAFDPLTAPIDQVSHLDQLGGGSVATEAPATPNPLFDPLPLVDPLVDPFGDAGAEQYLDLLAAADQPTGSDLAEPEATVDTSSQPDPARDLDAIFARLAAEYPKRDPLSPWADRLGDRSNRVVFMVVGSLGAAVVLFGLLSILSLLG